MKCLVLLSLVVLGCSALPSAEELHNQWLSFKQTHQKSYNALEELRRFNIFTANVKRIEEHNKLYDENRKTYKMAMNKFGDLSREEFRQWLKKSQSKRVTFANTVPYKQSLVADAPESFDWREQNAVSDVKDQGQCGSCWAFSVTGGLESANYIKNKKMVTVSEQELVDCSHESGNSGCNGGDMEPAYEYVIKNGIASEDDYPYEARDHKCRRGDIPAAISISKYVKLPVGDENTLRDVVGTIGPVSVGIDATDWQFYGEGVFYDDDCYTADEMLNHGVLAIGYGNDSRDGDFWLVKNSWGTSWGENGFIKTARNRDNNCGIATDSSYPIAI